MLSQIIRKKFLQYFKDHGHFIAPSSLTIPHEDPTLLFTNAGMNQFKDVFLGRSQREYKKAATSQKCIRVGGKHNDLDNVGHTSRHMTFFEMLGNFSFGDYFKKEAIRFAYEVSLNVYGFDKNKIWVTVYEKDQESFEYWLKYFPQDRIVKMGKKDNFWTMGDVGPCGPCSELFYDCGSHLSQASTPKEDPEGIRFLEFWNLVFMEFDLQKDGHLTPLPQKGVDTGSGLERVVSIIDQSFQVFSIDIFQKIIQKISDIAHVPYRREDKDLAAAFHVIADHVRSLSFAIADGAQPSNIDRGYVLRKVLRRAVRYGKLLNIDQPFLAKLVPTLIDIMGENYPELKIAEQKICEILTVEEENFFKTLKRGGNILSTIIAKAKSSKKSEISGEDAFKLKDTYGFPLEEILLIARDNHLLVNLETYSLLEEQAKERSKKSRAVQSQKVGENLFDDFCDKYDSCEFTGYTESETESTILAIVKNGEFVQTINAHDDALIILDKTPFYAEKGGQISDVGKLSHHRAEFNISHVYSPSPSVIVHQGQLEQGVLICGEPIKAKIDKKRRALIENNHSATHLLHWALQKVLGEHIKQAGSLVEPSKLRFDFNHHKAVSYEEIRQVERLINEKIQQDLSVTSYELTLEEAQNAPDIKQFFGDKYGSIVRVIDMDGFSKELCGGTHVSHLGKLSLFKITKESSIAQGVRRIEAVTAQKAVEFVETLENRLYALSEKLSAPLIKLEDHLDKLLFENGQLKNDIKKFKHLHLNHIKTSLDHLITEKNKLRILSTEVDLDPKDLTSFASSLLSEKKLNCLLLGAKFKDKCQIIIKLDQLALDKGFNAKELLQSLTPLIQGGGGGKAEQAQAGGSFPEGLSEAYVKFIHLIQEKC